MRLSVGRLGDDRPDSLDDDELTAATVAELSSVLDVQAPPPPMVTRWQGAFPQYRVGHQERTSAIEQAVEALPGVAVAGSAYRGVGSRPSSAAAVGRPGPFVRRLDDSTPARTAR